MAEEQLYGRGGVEQGQGYVPMFPDAQESPAPIEHTSADIFSEALVQPREEQDAEPIAYIDPNGKARPEKETVDLERAAQDLTNYRNAKATTADTETNQRLAERLDALRAEATPEPKAIEPTPPELPQVQEQTQEFANNDVDPEIQKALENPKVRAAIEHHIGDAERLRQAYVPALQGAYQAEVAAGVAAFPEFSGMNPQQVQGALALMQQQNPNRFAEVRSHLERLGAIQNEWAQAHHANQQREAIRFNAYAAHEDQKYEEFEATRPTEEVKLVREKVLDVVSKRYGIDPTTLAQLWQSSPIMRSSAVQRLFYDVTLFNLARESVQQKVHRPVPAVQRPGSPASFIPESDARLNRLESRLDRSGSYKDAAELLIAKRAQRR